MALEGALLGTLHGREQRARMTLHRRCLNIVIRGVYSVRTHVAIALRIRSLWRDRPVIACRPDRTHQRSEPEQPDSNFLLSGVHITNDDQAKKELWTLQICPASSRPEQHCCSPRQVISELTHVSVPSGHQKGLLSNVEAYQREAWQASAVGQSSQVSQGSSESVEGGDSAVAVDD